MKRKTAVSHLVRQLPLDICLAVCAIAVVFTLLLPWVVAVTERAYISGAISMMGSESRTRMVERIAIQGVLFDPSQHNQPLAHISGAFADSNQYPHFVYTDQGAGTLVETTLPRTGRAIALSFNALGPQGEPGWSVMWQCGYFAPPEGWSSPAPVLVKNLARPHLPSACKSPLAP
jgi:hypothetical protein